MLVRTKHDRVARVDKSRLVAGVADELASVKVVAGSREHDVESVYATAIVMLLMF